MRKLTSILILTLVSFVFMNNVYGDTLQDVDQFNNIVVFIRFNDETTYNAPYDYNYYENLFNEVDGISLRDYYLEASYGQLTIDSYIVNDNSQIIYYTDIYDRSYFEPYDEVENPTGVKENEQADREHALLKRAVDYVEDNNLVPDEIDLDKNNDGEIDSITFMVSGEDTGWNTLLWPHKWQLHTYSDGYGGYTTDAPSINGVYPYIYTFELLGNDTDYYYQVDVGVLAHETFHLLGAPDLYHYYEYLNVTPVGYWGLMEGAGRTPSHMLGYMKYKYGGWVDDVETISQSGSFTLNPLQDSASNMYRIKTSNPNEWLYLEYRDNLGDFESNLPESGLLVYRVLENLDGNESGSYDESGNVTDEVFIFRPGLDDTIPPIILENTEGEVYIDGSINDAALSDDNYSDDIGLGTDIQMFDQYGEILNITISNVVEDNGMVTFDVMLPPEVVLDTGTYDFSTGDLILYDNEYMHYQASITGVGDGLNLYYRTDGVTASNSDSLYEGETIEVTADTHITYALYDSSNTVVFSADKEFTFSSVIESEHTNYGDMQSIYWYFDYGQDVDIDLDFGSSFYLEDDYDYLTIQSSTFVERYTGDELVNQVISFTDDSFFIYLDTDEYVDDGYGFKVTVIPDVSMVFKLNGNSTIYHEVNTIYEDLGYTLEGMNSELYSVTMLSTVDSNLVGEYTVKYFLYDQDNNFIEMINRDIIIEDTTNPTVTLNDNAIVTVEVFDTYTDTGVTVSDNYDTELDIVVSGTVDTNTIGDYLITYTVTDDYDNETVVTKTVKVVDTIPPVIELKKSIDTVIVGEKHYDGMFNMIDNYDFGGLTGSVESTVDTSKVGVYTVTYTATDLSGNTSTYVKYVHVIEDIQLEITCDQMQGLQLQNDTIEVTNCYVAGVEMDIDTPLPLNSNTGLKTIEYSLTIGKVTYTHTRYIYVISDHYNHDKALVTSRRKRYEV